MIYLVITAIATHYEPTAEAAAKHIAPIEWLALRNAIYHMDVGDELDVSDEISVIKLSGINKEFKK